MQPRKYIAIGDIHGCFHTAKEMLKRLEKYPDHELVFLGDYTDRGPSSREVVDLLIKTSKERSCVFIRGNHDQMVLDAANGQHLDLWMMNGGNTTLDSYGLDGGKIIFPDEHIDFFKATILYYDTQYFFFVHAGLKPYQTISEALQHPESGHDFIWERSHLHAVKNVWEKTVIFGHTPVTEPIIRQNMIGIDTGCVHNKPGLDRLTAVILPEMKFISVESLDKA